jgi:hypothetical protein
MLQNGLYSISFKSDVGNAEGSGVIVLLNGVLLGGDDALLYSGSYQQKANRFTATVITSRHTRGRSSLFGLDDATISFAGGIIGGNGSGFGMSADFPTVRLEVRLTFRRSL